VASTENDEPHLTSEQFGDAGGKAILGSFQVAVGARNIASFVKTDRAMDGKTRKHASDRCCSSGSADPTMVASYAFVAGETKDGGTAMRCGIEWAKEVLDAKDLTDFALVAGKADRLSAIAVVRHDACTRLVMPELG